MCYWQTQNKSAEKHDKNIKKIYLCTAVIATECTKKKDLGNDHIRFDECFTEHRVFF